eukprot:755994-Hanusia_phi.AAC.2
MMADLEASVSWIEIASLQALVCSTPSTVIMSSLLSSPHRGLSQRPAHARTIFVLLLLLLPQSCNSFISSQYGQLRHALLNSRQAVNSCTRSDARQRPGTPTMQQADRSDWLSFRERLEEQYVTVGSEGKAARKVNSVTDKGEASSNVWKYDVGELIQAGTLLFSINTQHPHVDQQFHKSLVLVLSHNPRYVQGIILNRPSQFSTENGWRLWHGGNIQGFSAPRDLKHYLCLHKLEGEVAQRVSAKVVDGIYFTSLNSAESLVQAGHAKKEDFVVFLGYVGWTSGDLEARVDSGLNRNWFIASVGKTTKSQVCNACQQVCQEYSKRCTKCVRKSTLSSDMLLSRVFDDLQHFESTEEEAGIDIWNTWMSAMGLRNYTAQSESLVEDAMMKEWARRILIDRPEEFTTPQRAIPMLKAGLLLRANGPAPFIFAREVLSFAECLYLHKSVVLILEDNNDQTVGVVLNRPMRTSVTATHNTAPVTAVKLSKFSPDLFGGRWLSFGGEYSAGNLSLIAIHSSEELARRKVGTRVSADSQFYICSMADVAKSVSAGEQLDFQGHLDS